jgi:tetratricopeptide (TPR) repeat protein
MDTKQLKTKTYKVCFTGIQHHATMNLFKNYLMQSEEIKVIVAPASKPLDSLKTLIIEKPDIFCTCNDTSTTYTKISLLLNIPKIRFQEDPPQNPKWRESFLYDLKSPLAYVGTGFDIGSLGNIPEDKLLSELINNGKVTEYYSSISTPLTDYFYENPIFMKDPLIKIKDIDIVFIGNIGNWTPENLKNEMEKKFNHISKTILNEIADKITYHSTEFHAAITDMKGDIKGFDPDTYNSLMHFYYEAIGRLRRINILRFIVREFGEKYNIHLYGHENMAEHISQKHYRGYLYDAGAVKDVYRRSKIAIYSNSRPPMYNWERFLEPYSFGCVGVVDYIEMGGKEFERSYLGVADIIRFVPKIKCLDDFKEIIPYYLEDASRTLLVDEVLKAGSIYSRVNITPVIGQYMCLFEYMTANKNISPYDLEMLKFDSEVASLCMEIAGCYLEIGDNENAEKFKELGEYFFNILMDNAGKSQEIACEYAYYYYRIKKYGDALRIIDELCTNLDRAIILKAKIYEKNKDYQKIIDTLLDFKTDDAKLMAEGFFLLGLALHNQGRLQDAIDLYKKVAEMDADYPLINYYRGLTAYCMNDMHGAKKYLQEAFRRTKDFADIEVLLGDAYFCLKEYEEAAKIYEFALKVIQTYEKNKDKEMSVIEKLSKSHLFKGDIETSVGYLDIILNEYDSGHVMSHVKLFLLLLSQNIYNNYFIRELNWLHKNNVPILEAYNNVSSEFPEVINEKIINSVLNLNIQNEIISDFRRGLKRNN